MIPANERLIPLHERFIRQPDNISCGPAALATAYALTTGSRTMPGGKDALDHFLEVCTPDKDVGTSPEVLISAADSSLSVVDIGPRPTLTKGGVILRKYLDPGAPDLKSMDDHWVVVLGIKGNEISVYCPYDHKISTMDFRSMDWCSHSFSEQPESIDFSKSWGVGLDMVNSQKLFAELRGEKMTGLIKLGGTTGKAR